MRHKRGSRTNLSQPETSCYMEQKIAGCSVMLKLLIKYSNLYFIDTNNTDDRSSRDCCLEFGKYCELGGLAAFSGSRPVGACGHATTDGTIPAVKARFLNTVLATRPISANRQAVDK